MSAIAGAAAVGCGGEGEEGTSEEQDLFGWGKKCVSGASSSKLLAGIDTFVVLMMENRSFDHYFGARKFIEGRKVEGLDGDEWNPDLDGNPVSIFQQEAIDIGDITHQWEACAGQFNGGKNDGFVVEHQKDLLSAKPHCGKVCSAPSDPMGYYVREQIPTLYELADAYTLCDRWFSSVMGPTWPNRFYLHAGTANGRTGNKPIATWQIKTIWEQLSESCLSGTNFYTDIPWATGGFQKLKGLGRMFDGQIGIGDTFEARAREGRLPNLSIIDPAFFGMGNDDHPPHDIMLGQAFINTIYKILANSPQWERTLFVITYDEHGSFYDHVAPPKTFDERPEFQQLGFRVPAVVIGPHVKRGHVSSTQLDHTSVISTLTQRWGFAPLNERVARTNGLADCIDPSFLGKPQPAHETKAVTISEQDAFDKIDDEDMSQRELDDAVRRGAIPRELDLRHEVRDHMRELFELGEKYGSIELTR
jgi:phospholipase C